MFPRFILACVASLLLVGCGISHTSNSSRISGDDATQHKVLLTWNPSYSIIKGYNVYRGVHPGGPYSRIADLVLANAYNDGWVSSGQVYYYVVTAVALNSAESGYSNEVLAAVP
jgi:fibronectin type 3 domain-containing protein